MNPVALALQVLAGRQRRRMFDRAGDDFATLRQQGDRRGDGGGGGFGGAGGKDDLAGILRAQQRRSLLVRAFQSRLGRNAKIVYRRGVAVKIGQKGHHRFQNHRVQTGGGVVIEINLFHLVPLGSVNRGSGRHHFHITAGTFHQFLLQPGQGHIGHHAAATAAGETDGHLVVGDAE